MAWFPASFQGCFGTFCAYSSCKRVELKITYDTEAHLNSNNPLLYHVHHQSVFQVPSIQESHKKSMFSGFLNSLKSILRRPSFDSPKSAIFICPSIPINIFSGFKSQ